MLTQHLLVLLPLLLLDGTAADTLWQPAGCWPQCLLHRPGRQLHGSCPCEAGRCLQLLLLPLVVPAAAAPVLQLLLAAAGMGCTARSRQGKPPLTPGAAAAQHPATAPPAAPQHTCQQRCGTAATKTAAGQVWQRL